ncbi:MAG: CPBP family intramembrane metalloprotease [Acidobacteriaceae bacterium]|nr:CPBP family intramembrane metalloprotease [Acidobacteriaceae bacterium]
MSLTPLPEMNEQPLDIQHDPDPAHEVPPGRRIPHLGHALLFFSVATFSVLLCSVFALVAVHASANEPAMKHPIAAAVGQLAGYAVTLAIAIPLFPIAWNCTFWQGIHWNWRSARRNAWKLLLTGVLLSLGAQLSERFIKAPDSLDLLELFRTPLSAWLTAIIGSFVPALMEEISFRGFLLPALATAYDWLALERTPAAVERWSRTTDNSTPAWLFGSILSSIAFALLHAGQLHNARGPLLVLFCVSLVLCLVRIRTRSVAAATLVHMAYDSLIFAEMCFATGGFRHLDRLLQ